jgi:transglutaminase-like putative cysteine protease
VYVPSCKPAEDKAHELCKGLRSLHDRYDVITRFVASQIMYDYVRKITIPKRNGFPNVERCWKLRMGICLDIAALTVRMLRAVSVPSSLVIGWANGNYHAWVESRIDGKRYLYDHDAKGKAIVYKRERMY